MGRQRGLFPQSALQLQHARRQSRKKHCGHLSLQLWWQLVAGPASGQDVPLVPQMGGGGGLP